MLWQDITITATTVVLTVSLIPQVLHGFKTKTGPVQFGTSIPTTLGLFVMAGTFFSLSLKMSAAVSLVTASLWGLLILQRILYEQNKKDS
ncbi:MAG: hypothetical protein KBD73_00525 [Candidatus Magasanikbacteria bacterium]|nr:hypothetical protein [Candidatus Magasanikbacteria bacterium]